MEKERNKPEEIKLKLQEIELPKMDLVQYVGKKEKINKISTLKGQYGPYVRIESTVLDVMTIKGEPHEIRASRNFGIYQDENGNYGWGKDTELGQFLKLKKAKTIEDLKGKEIVIQIQNKDDKQFLSFI